MALAKIAIIGAGLSGLATCLWLLEENPDLVIDLYEKEQVGGIVAKNEVGLLHKFAGLKAFLSPLGEIAENVSIKLIGQAEKFVNTSLILSKQLLRPALNEKQVDYYKRSASNYPELILVDNCQLLDPFLPKVAGLLIPQAFTLDTFSYTKALLQMAIAKKVNFYSQNITLDKLLPYYDQIVLATGANFLNNVKVTAVKGQLLELSWPENIPPLKQSISSHIYLVMSPDLKKVFIGATYEHHFKTENSEMNQATFTLYEKALALYPPLKKAKILSLKAGIRASTPSHQPIIGKLEPKIWYITGMGSKGLLYHAYYAKLLASQILKTF